MKLDPFATADITGSSAFDGGVILSPPARLSILMLRRLEFSLFGHANKMFGDRQPSNHFRPGRLRPRKLDKTPPDGIDGSPI